MGFPLETTEHLENPPQTLSNLDHLGGTEIKHTDSHLLARLWLQLHLDSCMAATSLSQCESWPRSWFGELAVPLSRAHGRQYTEWERMLLHYISTSCWMFLKGIYLPTSKIPFKLSSSSVHIFEDCVVETRTGHNCSGTLIETSAATATNSSISMHSHFKMFAFLKAEEG